MRDFTFKTAENLLFNMDVINLLTSIHEAKGRQELYMAKEPKELDKLIEIAKVQSTEASNAIEGIRTTETRLQQLLREKTTPRNRAEEEISGYRDALNVIHESFAYIPLTPNYILQLHKIMYQHVQGVNFGGCYKNTQNYIQAVDASGHPYTLFTPLPPYATPAALASLCEAFNKALEAGLVDPLILIPLFIHDFLCIHPFRDGNGRLSRLLTTLLLYRCGYYVGKYISLEAMIAKIKDLYYEALEASQMGWHENKEDATPFIKYMLSIIAMAYKNFEARLVLVKEKSTANAQVEKAFAEKLGKIKKSDIIELCPNLSVSAVEKGIAKLVADGKIKKFGTGKATFYVRVL